MRNEETGRFCLRKYGKWTCLKLNLKKCIFVPLWDIDLCEAAAVLESWDKDLAVVTLKKCTRFLGSFIGPGAHSCIFDQPNLKFGKLVKKIRYINEGMVTAIYIHVQQESDSDI